MKQENVFPVSLLATEQSLSRLRTGQRANGKIHSIQVKPCHKGNTNEPEVLREGGEEEEEAAGGNGLHMDLKEHRHHSYVVYLMKQSNPGAHVSLSLSLSAAAVHTHFCLIFCNTFTHTRSFVAKK